MADRQGMRRPGRWRPLLTLALCWLLVAQAMLSGLTVAGHAAAGDSDAFAAVICTPAGLQLAPGSAAPVDGPDRPHDMSCCLLGCPGTGAGLAPPPQPAALSPSAAPRTAQIAVPTGRLTDGLPDSPRSTRAPPTAV